MARSVCLSVGHMASHTKMTEPIEVSFFVGEGVAAADSDILKEPCVRWRYCTCGRQLWNTVEQCKLGSNAACH